MTGLSLDAGALIAIERGDPEVRALLREAADRGLEVHVIPEVVAQVWRGGSRQARLGALLSARGVDTPAYDVHAAREVGRLCGTAGRHDVVDAHVVWHARSRGHAVVTSDPEDLRALDPSVPIVPV
ncbi:putative nucleic acid-binding protein [Nocardioides sp. BE266]|uniref:type II toxin-antitoxin system VapC family toxin n=1 Tax=Nocardioides sp. BE266 TaxID=2817725 RepID=UPI00285DAD1B|nr:PIN domain-containing protein [Nocardioides sp. BE266]MDR7252290.1 putative nucleic acid-binding protein [Nocardioides sp. BE266]